MGKKSKLSAAEQQEVVLKLLRREEPAAVLARRYGVSEPTLYQWREKFLQGGQSAISNGKAAGDAQSRRIQELERELAERQRVVTQNDAYVAIAPFAAKTPFETWVLPRHHASSYAAVAANTLTALAELLQALVSAFNDALDAPPYNLMLHMVVEEGRPDYHWHIELLPRLTNQAGFDWGTGYFVNPTMPEDAARFLREALAMREVRA